MADALDAFMDTAQRIVYCSLATVDTRGRPRSRLVHAVWERDGDEVVGWVGSRPTPMRRRDAWQRLAAAPTPMGYDPVPIWPDGPEGDDFVALRLDPWRIQAKSAAEMAAGQPYRVWTP
jgi:hypothetical protein